MHSWLDWAIQISDHAVLGVKLRFQVPWKTKGHPTSWRPVEHEHVQEWFARNCRHDLDLHDFRGHILDAQDRFHVSKKQKASHIPEAAVWNFKQATKCALACHSRIYNKNGWDILVAWRRDQARHRLLKAARSGKVLARSKKLHDITEIIDCNKRTLQESDAVAMAERHFEDKFVRCSDEQMFDACRWLSLQPDCKHCWLDCVCEHDYLDTFSRIRRPQRRDQYKITVDAMECWCKGHFESFHKCIANIVSDPCTYDNVQYWLIKFCTPPWTNRDWQIRA